MEKNWRTERKPPNGSVNQLYIAVLIPEKVDFKSQWIRSNKVGRYIFNKENNLREICKDYKHYAPNVGEPQFLRMTDERHEK